MTTYEQIGLLTELLEKKEHYIEMSGNDERLIELYDQLEKARSKHVENMYMGIASRAAYGASLKEHKVDPFVAGGAAQGVAGLGAGIYAAGNAAARNDRIDASREYNKKQVFDSSMATASSSASLSTILSSIVGRLNRYEDIRSSRENYKKYKYDSAKRLMENRVLIEEARKEFLMLGDYKDSAELAVQCEIKAKTINKQNAHFDALKISLILSLVLTVFMFLFGGGFSEFLLFFFLICFVIGFIYCEFKIMISGRPL